MLVGFAVGVLAHDWLYRPRDYEQNETCETEGVTGALAIGAGRVVRLFSP